MPGVQFLIKIFLKKRFVSPMNSAWDPLKKHKMLFSKKKKLKCKHWTYHQYPNIYSISGDQVACGRLPLINIIVGCR